jgi:hypothetical protein
VSENLLGLNRDQLAKALGGNYAVIRAFEQIVNDVGGFPSTIEEANALAGTALVVAQSALASLAVLADVLAQIEGAPVTVPQIDTDDTAPRASLGTIAAQDADAVEVSGGTIDNTPIGTTTAAAAKFTTLTASAQITSTVADGIAPLIVASSTRVVNLNATFLNGGTFAAPAAIGSGTPNSGAFSTFGCNGRPPQLAYTLPAAATDAATNLNLTNAIRLALINSGICQ